MVETRVQWTAPAPVWPAAVRQAPDPTQTNALRLFDQPLLLRYTSDQFMDEFMTVLANDPARLGEYRAQVETWEEPVASPPLPESLPGFTRSLNRLRLAAARKAEGIIVSLPDTKASVARPLKLFQPAHQRFYLVAACLVCHLPGLPDRILDIPNEERAFFVLRRLRRQADGTETEYALITTPQSSQWRPLSQDEAKQLAPNEEANPLFGVNYTEDDGRRRRLFAGLIPVGKREALLAAPPSTPPAGSAALYPQDPRDALLQLKVIGPWMNLVDKARSVKRFIADRGSTDPEKRGPAVNNLKIGREQIQTGSWYILLDLASFLQRHVSNVWTALTHPGSVTLNTQEQAVITALNGISVSTSVASELVQNSTITAVATSLTNALQRIEAFRLSLEGMTLSYDRAGAQTGWPDFLYPLADPTSVGVAPASGDDPDKKPADDLRKAIVAALSQTDIKAAPPLPIAAQPVMDAGDPGTFVIRCVFECPHCGPFKPSVVSIPSDKFQMAAFFDPEAPTRPIRISLPLDTTPAGLRKFSKNTAFMMSDVLFCQMEGMRGLTLGDLVLSVLPWPFHKDLPSLNTGQCASGSASMGVMCTFSLPIITLAALIMLIIIVVLLDLVFRWLPFFFMCFPLPGFKAKPNS